MGSVLGAVLVAGLANAQAHGAALTAIEQWNVFELVQTGTATGNPPPERQALPQLKTPLP